MHYDFPIITRIEDVLPHIEGFDEIIIAEREGYKVINYMVSTPRLWERTPGWEIRRECRGIIFDENGHIMSRPFHKFFNLGEKEETLPQHIDITRNHVVMDKMDGSMIRPLIINDTLRLATKMGVTDIAVAAEQLLTSGLIGHLYEQVKMGFTPLFEYVAPTNKIVINYDEPKLVYLGTRDVFSGAYSLDKFTSMIFPAVKSHGSMTNFLKLNTVTE